MPDVDAVLGSSARTFYENLPDPASQLRLDGAIAAICYDPAIDGVRKFAFRVALPETDAVIYFDEEFWLIYRSLNAWTVAIVNIGFVDPATP